MTVRTIDLYEYFDMDRKGANGGYLTVFARSDIEELKRRVRPAMLVLPGGGYGMLSERESEPVALKFVDIGYTAFTLSYSVKTKYPVPFYECEMAMLFIRENSEKLAIDKVGAIGFSAGGHIAGLLATVKKDEMPFGNATERVLPDAVVLAYPVVTLGEYTHERSRDILTDGDPDLCARLSVENRVDRNSVPAFIWHTFEDDCVPVENSLKLAKAYREHGVPFALHIFEHGRHGLSIANDEVLDKDVRSNKAGKWFDLAADWLRARGFAVKIADA